MKFNRLLLCALATVSVLACNKENDIKNKPNGETFASLVVSVPKTRAAVTDADGTAIERAVTNIKLYASTPYEWTALTTPTSFDSWKASVNEPGKFAENAGKYYVQPFKMQVGEQKMALAVNFLSYVPSVVGPMTLDYVVEDSNFPTLISSFGTSIPMTSALVKKDIKANLSASEVAAAPEGTEAKNSFLFGLERITSKGTLIKSSDFEANVLDGSGKVDVDNLTYAPVNGATRIYYFANYAGTNGSVNGIYDNFKSAIHDDGTKLASDPATAKTMGLVRLGNYASDPNVSGAKAVKDEANAESVYFLENSVEAITQQMKSSGFERLAYAKVYAVFTPTFVFSYDSATGTMVRKDNLVSGTTFYKGEKDGLLYDSKESAKHAEGDAANQRAYTYTNGKCGYRVLWNRQVEGDNVIYANVRRNNTYKLTIESVEKLGMPWDSTDPKDPNLPKPDDVDEPDTRPDDPSIQTERTYMRVTATIIPWNVVPIDNVTLGGRN